MPIPSWLTTDSRRKELSGVCFKVPKNGLLLVGNNGVAMPVTMTTVEVAVVYCTGIVDGLEANSIEELRLDAYSLVNSRDERTRCIDNVIFGVDSDEVIGMDVVAAATDHLVANLMNIICHAD